MLLDFEKHIIAFACSTCSCLQEVAEEIVTIIPKKKHSTKIMETAKPQARNYGEVLLVAGSDNLSLFKGDIEKSPIDVYL